MTSHDNGSSLALLGKQRSHVLFVLSQPETGREAEFLDWYRGPYRQSVLDGPGVLGLQQYEQHEVDVTRGKYPPLPFKYLGIHQLSLDGAEEARGLIDKIAELHRKHAAAQAPATWLYYPISEKVGRAPRSNPSLMTIAFANGTPGQEAEFREWYATRHIRHAMNVPALVSGQCFERTLFQQAGAIDARFSIISLYEQDGSAEEIVQSLVSMPKEKLRFPTLDVSRFAEWIYRPV